MLGVWRGKNGAVKRHGTVSGEMIVVAGKMWANGEIRPYSRSPACHVAAALALSRAGEMKGKAGCHDVCSSSED